MFPPSNPFDDDHRNMTRIGVYVSSAADQKPTEEDFRPDVICTRVKRLAGSKLSEAEFVVNLAEAGKNIENREVLSNASRQVEVWTLRDTVDGPNDSIRDQCLFWGELLTDRIRIDANQDEVWVAKVAFHHFGEPVEGMQVYDKIRDELKTNHMDIEFNPELDGVIEFNMWPADATNNSEDYPIWVDPESVRTEEAEGYVGDPAEEWTLADIVESLSSFKNGDETFVENPSREKLDDIFTDAPDVVNLVLTTGGFLPEYLDAVLQPLGYNWFAKTEADENNESKTRIVIYQRGEGQEKEIRLQAFGEDHDPVLDNADLIDVEYDYALSKNRIRVQGALIQREVTLPLWPAWEFPQGEIDHSDVTNIIGRKWVASEGGAYLGVNSRFPDDPPDLGEGFGVVKNRVMEDCLTLRAGALGKGQRRPPFVEWNNGVNDEWKDLNSLPNGSTWRLLPTEVGIYFTGTSETGAGGIPEDVVQGGTIKLRITGTITGDYRIEHRTAKSEDSPVENEVERIVRAHSQFFDRKRQDSGDFASKLIDGNDDVDERDDTDAIEAYADKLLENETAAKIQATIRLFDLNYEYEIGDVITRIDGRAISLNRASQTATPRYVQVVGIEYVLQGRPSTNLIVQQYDIA